MSVRVHVLGAFGASEAALRTALDQIGDGNGSQRFRVGRSGRWIWAHASVWHVGGSEIDEALASLPVPALRVTSSDGVLWTLTLTGGGRDTFRGVHHFTWVGSEPEQTAQIECECEDGFPEDELVEVAGIDKFIPELQFLWDAEEETRLKRELADEAEATVAGLDDYIDYGVNLPQSVINEMKHDPTNADYAAFMAHGPQIVEALEECGIEFDRAEMLNLLTVGPLTDLEQESDIGNMPRFLRTLGIEDVFQQRIDEDATEGEVEDDYVASDESSVALSEFEIKRQELADAAERFDGAKTAPHGDEVLYEGRTGRFFRASLFDLEHVSREKLKEFDAIMADYEFVCVGDSVSDADERQEISRCYVGHLAIALHSHRKANNSIGWAEVSDGMVMVDFSKGTVEFHTHFDDGTTLATTTVNSVISKPEKGIFVRSYEGVPVVRLWEKHQDGIQRFKAHRNASPIDHRELRNHDRFFETMDNLLGRYMGLD